ncbi:MAG: alpha/beta hydrolase-fold protein, partial [Bacteroidota bacterium]
MCYKITQLLILIITTSLNTVSAQNTSKDDNKQSTNKSYLELPKIKVIPIQDTGNDRAYELYVKLPEKYSESPDVNYPVIYYTDAMWHVEMLSGAAEYIMEDAILVGISWQKDNKEELVKERGEHVSRFRDYSVRPSTNANHQAKYEFGQASAHLDFIRKDVIPYVENNYRTDPNKRTYFGYSLGGVFGAYTLLSHPNTFKNYILGSPALDGDIPYITELDANTRSKQNGLNANVFISYGSLERELSQYADEFITLLKNRNDPSLELKHVVIEGSHQTAFPATAVQGVTWLTQITSFPVLDGQYFGQKEPGLTPEVFAPGVVSIDGRFEGAISFSPDLKEMYFGANDENEETHIYFSKLEGTQWTPIKRVNFTKAKKDEELHPLVSQDGRRVYFTVDDPDLKEPKIWYVNR